MYASIVSDDGVGDETWTILMLHVFDRYKNPQTFP